MGAETAYALQINEDSPYPQRQPSSLQYLSVVATVLACVAIALGGIAVDSNRHLSRRMDSSVDAETVSEHAVRTASMVQSAISAHPVCSKNLQACVDLMNITSHLATRNLSLPQFASPALSTKRVQAGLFTAQGKLVAGPHWMAQKNSLKQPQADFANCELTHHHTCIMTHGDKMVSLTRVSITGLPEDFNRRRDWGSAVDEGFQYGKDGAEFGAAMGGAAGTLAAGVGSAVGGAVGGLVGGAAGFAVGAYEGY